MALNGRFPSFCSLARSVGGFLSRMWVAAPALAIAAPAAASADSARPNVLMIIADDLNTDVGCFGNEVVKTPNMDRLASRGILFSRAYAPWASCLVSRYSFLSGWFPTRTGAQHRFWPNARDAELRDAVYLPQYFKQQGYFTARLDKVFHIGKDDPQSWNITEEPYKDADGKFRPTTTGVDCK